MSNYTYMCDQCGWGYTYMDMEKLPSGMKLHLFRNCKATARDIVRCV